MKSLVEAVSEVPLVLWKENTKICVKRGDTSFLSSPENCGVNPHLIITNNSIDWSQKMWFRKGSFLCARYYGLPNHRSCHIR